MTGPRRKDSACATSDCTNQRQRHANGNFAREVCNSCYYRRRKHGDLAINLTGRNVDPVVRLFEIAVEIAAPSRDAAPWLRSAAPCLLIPPNRSDGYVTVRADGKNRSAHRVIYERTVGPIPEGMTIDHNCTRTNCIQGEHLEPITAAENLSRSHITSPRRKLASR